MSQQAIVYLQSKARAQKQALKRVCNGLRSIDLEPISMEKFDDMSSNLVSMLGYLSVGVSSNLPSDQVAMATKGLELVTQSMIIINMAYDGMIIEESIPMIAKLIKDLTDTLS